MNDEFDLDLEDLDFDSSESGELDECTSDAYFLKDLQTDSAENYSSSSNEDRFNRLAVKRLQEIMRKLDTFSNLASPNYRYASRKERWTQFVGCLQERVNQLKELL